jgi:hypothetical protein
MSDAQSSARTPSCAPTGETIDIFAVTVQRHLQVPVADSANTPLEVADGFVKPIRWCISKLALWAAFFRTIQ